MPQETFQYKHGRTDLGFKRKHAAPSLITTEEKTHKYKFMSTSWPALAGKGVWGESCLQITKWGQKGQISGKSEGGSARFAVFCGYKLCLSPWWMSHKYIPLIKRSVDYELLAPGQRDAQQSSCLWAKTAGAWWTRQLFLDVTPALGEKLWCSSPRCVNWLQDGSFFRGLQLKENPGALGAVAFWGTTVSLPSTWESALWHTASSLIC